MMKKISAVLLILLISLWTPAAFAADVIITVDFDDFAGSDPTQDPSTFTWMGFNQWNPVWTVTNFEQTDTWAEPSARGGETGGTAMRIFTNDATTDYNESTRGVLMNRPRAAALGTAYPEMWYHIDWMVEDHNADHYIVTYLDNVYNEIFSIDKTGALSTLAGDTGIIIEAGTWHRYTMCMSKTDGLFFYLDGKLIGVMSQKSAGGTWNAQNNLIFYQKLYNDGNGKFKGSAMQIDNFEQVVAETPKDKGLYGFSDEGFTADAEAGNISFSVNSYNFSDVSHPFMMVLSIYNEKGEYVGYSIAEDAIGTEAPITPSTVTFEQWEENWSAKVHILKSWSDRTGFVNKIYTYGAESATE